jgi:hypothetical protein
LPDPFGASLLRRLTTPIAVDFALDLGDGLALNSTVSGTVVVFALVPEPGTAVLVAIGLAALASCRDRR